MTTTALTRRAPLGGEAAGVWAAAGFLVLGAAMQSVVMLRPGWLTIVLALAATIALARDPRLGWIPAGMLVAVALPFGRGGDVDPLMVFGLPLRPQDGAVALALLGGAWSAWRGGVELRRLPPMSRIALALLAAFLGLGLVALVIGLLRGHQAVDILRDARWWGLYLLAPLAILAGVRRSALLRALLIGITLFSVLVAVTAVLPRFDGALKDQVYAYDHGLLRLQFGNSVLLLPAVAYVLWSALRRPTPWRLAWLGLLFGAQLLSLTRVSIYTTIVVAAVLVVIGLRRRSARAGRSARWTTLAAIGVLTLAMVGAVGLSAIGTGGSGSGGTGPENPFLRLTFQGSSSDFASTVDSIASGGRFDTYLNALDEISRSPAIGGGLGQLVDVLFASNQARARTVGTQPGVDNAYLTVGLKAGAIGMVLFAALILLPLRAALDRRARGLRPWYVAGWAGVVLLTLTQGFAVSSYGPFALAGLLAVPFLGYASRRRLAASGQA